MLWWRIGAASWPGIEATIERIHRVAHMTSPSFAATRWVGCPECQWFDLLFLLFFFFIQYVHIFFSFVVGFLKKKSWRATDTHTHTAKKNNRIRFPHFALLPAALKKKTKAAKKKKKTGEKKKKKKIFIFFSYQRATAGLTVGSLQGIPAFQKHPSPVASHWRSSCFRLEDWSCGRWSHDQILYFFFSNTPQQDTKKKKKKKKKKKNLSVCVTCSLMHAQQQQFECCHFF